MVEGALKDVVHIGFIVHDVDKAIKELSNVLGIKPWNIWILRPPFLRDTTVHGKPVAHGFKAAIASLGNVSIELLAPLEGESVYVEYLKNRGEGFHHVAFAFPSEKKLDEAVKKLKDKGGIIVQSGRLGDLALYYYVDVKRIGLVLELFTGTVPPPDKTYP
jgi:catechol 2,3-dioxygenase-like lactoylglutathione lyase family enzyme